MKATIICLFWSILFMSHTYASEIKIAVKHSGINYNNEISTAVTGSFEKDRYIVRPNESTGRYLEVYDWNHEVWRSNFDLWNKQILVEDMQKIKFSVTPNDISNVYFEILDLKTSDKYKSATITIFSNREEINFLNTLNQNLKKSD